MVRWAGKEGGLATASITQENRFCACEHSRIFLSWKISVDGTIAVSCEEFCRGSLAGSEIKLAERNPVAQHLRNSTAKKESGDLAVANDKVRERTRWNIFLNTYSVNFLNSNLQAELKKLRFDILCWHGNLGSIDCKNLFSKWRRRINQGLGLVGKRKAANGITGKVSRFEVAF